MIEIPFVTFEQLVALGGIFALLVFWHFFADWFFQTHAEAMAKAKDGRTRAWHCLKYALLFTPVMALIGVQDDAAWWAFTILFGSHYIIDSYVPVMLWAKWLRQAPHFDVKVWLPGGWEDKKIELVDASTVPYDKNQDGVVRQRTLEEGFKAFIAEPIGIVLMIVMDQFMHIAFLLPVAYIIVMCR